MIPNILLIEDQADVQRTVKTILGPLYRLSVVATAAGALAAAERSGIDLVLLDVKLPDEDGFHLFTRLKALPALKAVPIIFLTGQSAVTDRVTGFSLGADDYIVKPFEPLEFRARIEAKLQSRLLAKEEGEVIRKGRLELNRAMIRASAKTPSGEGVDLRLTPSEFRLLAHFVLHEGHVLSRDQLMTAAWGDEVHVLDRTIDRHVSSLRKKLDPAFETIEAIHGVGYRFSLVQRY